MLKTVVVAMPIPPTYGGNNDLEIFMKWLQAFLNYLDVHQLVGERYDHHQVIIIRGVNPLLTSHLEIRVKQEVPQAPTLIGSHFTLPYNNDAHGNERISTGLVQHYNTMWSTKQH